MGGEGWEERGGRRGRGVEGKEWEERVGGEGWEEREERKG